MKTASALQFHILFYLIFQARCLLLLLASFRSVDAAADLLQLPDLAPCRFLAPVRPLSEAVIFKAKAAKPGEVFICKFYSRLIDNVHCTLYNSSYALCKGVILL